MMDTILGVLIGAGSILILWIFNSVKLNIDFKDISDFWTKSKEERKQKKCPHGEPEIVEHEGGTQIYIKYFFENHPQDPRYKVCKRCNIVLSPSRVQDVIDFDNQRLYQAVKEFGLEDKIKIHNVRTF